MTIKSWHWRIRAGEGSADWRVLRPNLSVNVRAVNGLISCPGETPPHLALTLLKTHSSGLIDSKHRFRNFYWGEAALISWRCPKAHELVRAAQFCHTNASAWCWCCPWRCLHLPLSVLSLRPQPSSPRPGPSQAIICTASTQMTINWRLLQQILYYIYCIVFIQWYFSS